MDWERMSGAARWLTLSLVTIVILVGQASAQTAETPAETWLRAWPNTDFSRHSVPFDEILNGGVPKDGIPALDSASFGPAAEETGLDAREPVIALVIEGEARAYPIRYLIWHEIVNDRIGGRPVTVTYCPLCNSAIVFDGLLGDEALTFGVSGKLRHSDMVMYDRQSESWWQQFTGEAIVGERLGQRLEVLPSALISWALFREDYPEGLVMREPTLGGGRPYGRNPYVGYDESYFPFLFRGDMPPHDVPALARVVRVGDRAWPLERVAKAGEIVEDGVRLTWRAGQASALEKPEIAEGRDVGDVRVFDAGSGALIVHEVVFAFAFHAFEPDGRWMLGADPAQ